MSATTPRTTDTASDTDWYDPTVYPELRTAAPWVMDEMMDMQPTMVAETMIAVDEAAGEVANWLHDAVASGSPIVTTGIGTAGHAARGVAVALNAALGDGSGGRVEYRESEDQARAPRAGGLCIAVSHGGKSASSINALAAARTQGARTALITAATGTPSHDLANTVFQLPLRDRSYCHTIGYTTPIACGLQIGARYSGAAVSVEAVTAYLAELLSLRGPASEIAAAMSGTERIISAGSLTDEPSARELALDVAEAAWIPASVFGVEDVLHGHMVAHDSASALAVVLTGGPHALQAAATTDALLRAANRIGIRTTLITTEKLAAHIEADSTLAGRLILPNSELPEIIVTLLGGAIALQTLTMALVNIRGTNPDLLRREDAKYREAVTIGGAKLPRTEL